ncbi:MAG TPA: hypothetical protein PK916_08355 [Bacteroidota bacterium]|nr:hypothetical protein [Bacteroidota bacterium]
MKRVACGVLLMIVAMANAVAAPGGEDKSFRASDTRSIDGVLAALYGALSGPAGTPRDWKRLRTLFHEQARVHTVLWKGGERVEVESVSVEEFIRRAAEYMSTQSFYEREIARRCEQVGHAAQVLSTSVILRAPDDPFALRTCNNTVQLYYDGRRWWILSLLREDER